MNAELSHDERYHRKPWMTDDQWACAQMIADVFGGFHHLVGKITEFGQGINTNCYSGVLATFDFDRLTRLVLLAHDRCIRVEIISSGPNRVGIAAWKRKTRNGSMSQRHPTIDEAIAVHRIHFPEVLP